MTVDGLPLFKPPYFRVTAIDMSKGERLWMSPLGNGPRNHPLLKELNLPPLGGDYHRGSVLVTKTLLFVSMSALHSRGVPELAPWAQWADPADARHLMYVFDKLSGHIAEIDRAGWAVHCGADDATSTGTAVHRRGHRRRSDVRDRGTECESLSVTDREECEISGAAQSVLVYKEASMRLGRPKVALILTDDERVRLNSLTHRSRSAPHVARRARIILACAEGHDNKVVATRLRMSQVTVCKWRAGLFVSGWTVCMTSRVRARRARSRMNRLNR